QIFETSDTCVKPYGVTFVLVFCIGRGSGGGGGAQLNAAGNVSNGGGSGGVSQYVFPAAQLGATESVTVGASRAGATGSASASTVAATTGNATTFGTTVKLRAGGGPSGIGNYATGA